MADLTVTKCREMACELRVRGNPDCDRTAALLERAANRIEMLTVARGRLLEVIERARAQKRHGQRTSRGEGCR